MIMNGKSCLIPLFHYASVTRSSLLWRGLTEHRREHPVKFQFSRILVLYRREVLYKAGPCFNFSYEYSIKPKRAAILFDKTYFLSILDFVHWEMNKISYSIKRSEN